MRTGERAHALGPRPSALGAGRPGHASRTIIAAIDSRAALALVAIVAVALFANSLVNGFVLDDHGVIERNLFVTAPATAWRTFAHPYWPEAIGGGQYRPLTIVSFALDWAIGGGDARWFHVVNVAWHASASIMVWRLARELLDARAAVAAALLFAAHPVHVEAVGNVVGRSECMAAALAIAALLAHRRASRWAPVLLALALLAKESAVVVIGLALAHDALVAGEPARAALHRRRGLFAAYGAVVLAYGAVLALVFGGTPMRVVARGFLGLDTSERLLTVASVVPHWARLLVAPVDLSADYEPGVIAPAMRATPLVLLGLAIVVGYALVVVRAWRRDPVAAFSLLWIPIALAPVSNVLFASGVTLAERTLYLPSVGVVLAAGWLVERAPAHASRAVGGLVAAVLLGFAARTWTRTPVWRDDRTWLLTLLAEHPESYRAHLTAGRVQRAAGRLDEAERELAESRRLFARDPLVYREAASRAAARGRGGEARVLLDSAELVARAPASIALRAEAR